MMTKQEEREALKKIEKIIKGAGPESYIGMAFAGCCEVAASNIENDFADSWKERADCLADQVKHFQEKSLRFESEYSKAWEIIAKKEEEIKALKKQLKAEQAKQIPADLYKLVWLAVDSHIERANRRIADCVEELVHFADAPKDIAVAHALTGLREAHATKAQYTQLLEQLEAYEQKGA